MATGRERRAERLNERLRGAQRANVDESFNLDLGDLGIDLPASTSSAHSPAHDSPSSPVKRRKLNSDAVSSASQNPESSSRRRSARLGPKDLYDLPDTSKESPVQTVTASASNNQEGTPKSGSVTRPARSSSAAKSAISQHADQNPDELGTLAVPGSVQSLVDVLSPSQSRVSGVIVEEIGESPADAPGSGKRRRVPFNEAVSSSVRLLDVLASDDAFPASSSPLVRKTRRSDVTASVRSTRRSLAASLKGNLSQVVDELSPDRPNQQHVVDDEFSESRSVSELIQAVEFNTELEIPEQEEEEREEEQQEQQEEQEKEPEEEQEEPDEVEEAEEVDAIEAAKVLGKKRARPPRALSPELGSGPVEEDLEEDLEEDEDEQPAPKRKKGRPGKSPATQKQPAVKPKPNKTKKRPKPQAQDMEDDNQEPRPKQPKASRRRSGQSEGDDGGIEITIQRFVNVKGRGEDDDADPLHTEIPFANRSGESVVDVFAQVCEEVISTTLAQFREMASNAADAAKKKECRIKMRAIEAYGEELNARFLQHVIHLNHWHSLRKRVRHVQKEKLALREEIIRIRAEREQVALRMDAVRIKHEADTKESKYCLDASTLMHDVDLAVEQGRDEPELSRVAQKEAELANLELLVSRVSEQASSASFTGGMLKQVKDFNAFLERAAVALETR